LGESGVDYNGVEEDRLMLEDSVSKEAIHVVPELGKGSGHTVRINRPIYTNTTYTEASRVIANAATISKTPIDVSSEQAAITLKRYGGPYSSTQSAVAPFGIDRFDASVSIHKLRGLVGKHLRRDVDKTLDTIVRTLFDNCSTNVRPTGFSTDDSSLVAGDAPMDFELLSRCEKNA
jgi:hypothetical protein